MQALEVQKPAVRLHRVRIDSGFERDHVQQAPLTMKSKLDIKSTRNRDEPISTGISPYFPASGTGYLGPPSLLKPSAIDDDFDENEKHTPAEPVSLSESEEDGEDIDLNLPEEDILKQVRT